ncbi:MAG: YbaN family protein [Fibrobacterota bacterium]
MKNRKENTPMLRYVYQIAGLLAVALGSIGLVLPLLPTTPFYLLSTWCFLKSSPRLHRWLLNTRAYQHTAGSFMAAGGLTITAKLSILIPVLIMLTLMFFSVKSIALKTLALVLGAVKTVVFIRIPTISPDRIKRAPEKSAHRP